MGRKGASIGLSQPTPCSGRKTLKRCKNNEEADNVVVIDVENYSFDDVIIIDVAEAFPKKLQGSSALRKDRKYPLRTVICIDDDNEYTNNEDPEIEVTDDGNFHSDASSSTMRSCPASNHPRNSTDAGDDGCQFDQEKTSPVRLSKCKRTYSGKASSRNRYGLNTEFGSGSSNNDCPDCEVMEDSSGKLREKWERASSKRKYDVHNGQSGRGDYASVSRVFTDTHQDIGLEKKTEQQMETPVCTCSSKADCEQEDLSPFNAMGDGNLGSTSQNSKKTTFDDLSLKSMPKTQDFQADVPHRADPLTEDPSCTYTERRNHQYFEKGGSSFHNEEEPNSHAHKSFQDREKAPLAEPCLSKCESSVVFCQRKAFLADEEAPSFDGKHSVETEMDSGKFVFGDKDENFLQTPTCNSHFSEEPNDGRIISENLKSMSRSSSFLNTQAFDETQVNLCPSSDKVRVNPVEAFCHISPSLGTSGISVEKDCHQENGERSTEEPTFYNCVLNEAQPKQERSLMVEEEKELDESVTTGQQNDESYNLLHNQGGDVMHAVQSCIINEREILKQTDDYKRAMEEEWASRQRELQIQAEEAQQLRRLRKRRKAESMRLLDMERRQKQRLEEMRETQKKDEENMNLKEQVRAEVRKELNKLEISCHDMASLLRGLGIHTSGALHPLPHEVHAAYKRAVLTFHPDRASGSDMRQLVEAEEKFKLISRMKEKFLLTS
ncbi:unnamed protein product [Ilex paraguariensis]|uniref:J domain-containing protein n=1 Tax=Ilex paraguariensis TaxID=185542 RepID=A0ABC8RCG4_9AQUA